MGLRTFWLLGSLGSVFVLLSTGCGAHLGAAQDLVPLTGQTRAASPVAEQPAWYKTALKGDLVDERSRETARAAYEPKSQLMWIGTVYSSLQCLNSASGRVLWETPLPGGTRGEALWHDGLVYLGTEGGKVVAVDAATGVLKWSYVVQAAVRRAPVVSGDLIIFVDGANTVIALEHRTGKWRWQYRRDPPKHFALAGEARPIIVDGRVHLGFSDGRHVALSALDGTVTWSRQLADPKHKFQDADAVAVFADGILYAASVSGDLYALDPAQGTVKWQYPLGGALQLAAYDSDLIAAQEGGRVVRFDTFRKKIAWQVTVKKNWGSPTGIERSGDKLVMGWSKGGLYWIDGRTGSPQLQFLPGAGFTARPLTTSDGVYALGNQGTLFAFRVGVIRKTQGTTPLTTSAGRGL